MAGRPRKNEKVKGKNRKGSGTVTVKTQKIDRKENRLSKMCKICSECEDRSVCDFRAGTKKCKKCLECKETYCDRFYIYTPHTALSSAKGGKKRRYLGRFENIDEAQDSINISQNGGFKEPSNTTLFQILEDKNNKNLEANEITTNTNDRNRAVRIKMQRQGLADKKMYKITTDNIQNYLNSLKDSYSQSEIDKHYNEIKSGFKYAMKKGIISNNVCDDLIPVTSNLPVKIARPFEIDEQNLILDYIENNKNITDSRSTMDDTTFRNAVRLAFNSGQRIGELLALQTGYDKKHYTSDINFEDEYFKISKTITRDNNTFILGNRTKNSRKLIRNGLSPERLISFNIASSNVIESILREQIIHSKSFEKNTNHFLFCNKNGDFINPAQITVTFKRICRILHIQEDNPTGCFIHQARHSFVTRCLEAGLKVETIAELIGDTVEQVQKTYAHILKRFQDDELSKLHKYYKDENIRN